MHRHYEAGGEGVDNDRSQHLGGDVGRYRVGEGYRELLGVFHERRDGGTFSHAAVNE